MASSLDKVVTAALDPSFSVSGRVYRAAYTDEERGVQYFGLEGIRLGALDICLDGTRGRAFLNDAFQHSFGLANPLSEDVRTIEVSYRVIANSPLRILQIDGQDVLKGKKRLIDRKKYIVSEEAVFGNFYRIRPKIVLSNVERTSLEDYETQGEIISEFYEKDEIRIGILKGSEHGNFVTMNDILRTFQDRKGGSNDRALMRKKLRKETNIQDHYFDKDGNKVARKNINPRNSRYKIPLDVAFAAQRYLVDNSFGFVRL